jgi:thioredoxin-like negative regulator of GroEL
LALAGLAGLAAGLAAVVLRASRTPPESAVRFVDVAGAAGIDFVHENGARGRRYLPEITIGGAAWIDFDRDGRLDLYFPNGNERSDRGGSGGPGDRLYRNLGGGRFEDATAGAGLDERGYGGGVAVGDYDNDGWSDIYVAKLGANVLYRNLGGGRFEDVTARAGVTGGGWSSAAAFLDYDLDGFLDLYVCRYLDYDPQVGCQERGRPTYCSPRLFPGLPDLLYRNLGDGTFEEIGRAAGIAVAGPSAGKSLGVIVLDADEDGDPDVFVACDQVPNLYFANRGDGSFEESSLPANLAYGADGQARAGMGVDAGDFDLDGREDIVVTNFAGEPQSLFHNLGGGFFNEESLRFGIAGPTLEPLGFGVLFIDAELDGDLDLFVANGHVLDNIAELQPGRSFSQPDLYLENASGRGFRDRSRDAGEWFSRAQVSRGAASCDFDEDGDEDLAVLVNGGRAALLENRSRGGRWIAFRLRGTRSNRDGYGARLELRARRGGEAIRRVAECRSARSYASACDPRVRFGLGGGPVEVEALELRWPSGIVQRLERPAIDRVHEVVEPEQPSARAPVMPPARPDRPPAAGTTLVEAPPPAARQPDAPDDAALAAAEILSRVESLARVHRVREALEWVQRHRPKPVTGDADVRLALREKEAQLLVNLARPLEAVRILEPLVREQPERDSAGRWLSRAYLEAGDVERALAAYEALPAAARRAEILLYGRALLAASRAERAAAVFAALLIIDPWHESAGLELGRALARAGLDAPARLVLDRYRGEEARRQAEHEALSFEAAEQPARALHVRAAAERRRGRLYECWKLESEAIRADPKLGDAYLELARLWLELARPQDALAVLEALPEHAGVESARAEARRRIEERGTPRAEARDRMAEKPIAACGPELLFLARRLEAAGDGAAARAVALFLFRLAPKAQGLDEELLRLFDALGEAFVRLWALREAGGGGFAARIESELAPLQLDAGAVRQALR